MPPELLVPIECGRWPTAPASRAEPPAAAAAPATTPLLATAVPPPPDPSAPHAFDPLDTTAVTDLLPPGERRARLAAVSAAWDLVPHLQLWQASRILGMPLTAIRRADPRVVTADLVRVIGFSWSAGYIRGALREWLNIYEYAYTSGRVAPGEPIYGNIVTRYMDTRHDAALRKHIEKYRRKGIDPPNGSAAVHAARGALATKLKWLAVSMHFRIDVSCTAAKKALRRARRTAAQPAPSLSPRMVINLSLQCEEGASEFVRGHAGGFTAQIMFALRMINAQRSAVTAVANGVVYGECDLDAKLSTGQQSGRQMWATERDCRGSNTWLRALAAMLSAGSDSSAEHFFIRATNSPTGDPHLATEWRDGPETAARSRASLCALLSTGRGAVPAATAAAMTGHSSKHVLPNVGRALHLASPEINEIGRWAGSRGQRATAADAGPDATAAADACPQIYSAEAANEVVPMIMEKVVSALRRLASTTDVAALPDTGGWSLLA